MRFPVRLSMAMLLLAAAPVLSNLAGCAVEAPTALPGQDMKGEEKGDMRGHATLPDLATDEVLPPTFDALTRTTNYMSVPVHGTAQPGSSVIIEGTANGNISAEVGSDGRFCADIKLMANRLNVLSVYTDNNHGIQSDKIEITITQSGTPPTQTTVQQTSQNSALGGDGSSDLSATRNTPKEMIDHDPTTSYGGRHWYGDHSYMTVQLVERSKINKVMLKSAADCPFTAPLKLYMSNLDAPSSPLTAPMSWIEVPIQVSEPQAVATFATPVIATHFSVVWDPYYSWGWHDINCGSSVTGPYYAVSEFEAWTAPGVTPPPPAAPTCLGGGVTN